MHYRVLGRSKLMVSEIGMGCNRLGEAHTSDRDWEALVHRAVELGVTLFDTAEAYGWGRSEEILGRALVGRDDILIATKVSRDRESGERNWSSERILQRVEGSLRRLKRDCIDIYQLHSPSLEQMRRDDWQVAMQRLRDEGKVRMIGVSINDVESGRWLIEAAHADVLQVAYNFIEPDVGRGLFPLAERCGVGILVRMPMARGVLTGKFRPEAPVPKGHRARLDGQRLPESVAAAERYRALGESYPGGMQRLALHYAISPRGVSAAIPGTRNIAQLEENLAASNGKGLDEATLAAVARIQEGVA